MPVRQLFSHDQPLNYRLRLRFMSQGQYTVNLILQWQLLLCLLPGVNVGIHARLSKLELQKT